MRKINAAVSLLLILTVLAGLIIPCSAQANSPQDINPPFGSRVSTAAALTSKGSLTGLSSMKDSVFYDKFELPATIPIDIAFGLFKSLRYAFYFLSGNFLYGAPKTFDVTLSDDIIALCDYMNENSALDLYSILTNAPDLNDFPRLAGKVLHIDTAEMRAQLYEMRDKFYEEDNISAARLCWVLGSYMSGLEKADIYTVPYEDVYEVEMVVTYSDGGTETLHPNLLIDFETGKCYDKYDRGMINMGFDNDLYDLVVYAPMYCWMRDFGFCIEYDILCYLLPVYRYRTRRFKFNYGEKEWMIQCWKGNYMCTNGGEVGIYNRHWLRTGSRYDVIKDDSLMPMSLTVTHGDDVLVNIPETPHWWVNGFKLANTLYHPMSLTETFSIIFPDEEMRDAFCKAVDRNIYHDVTYTVDGLKVMCVW
jgi:hypothetical protein